MIIAWLFMVSAQVINSDSNYKFMKSVINGMLKQRDDLVFVVYLPFLRSIYDI